MVRVGSSCGIANKPFFFFLRRFEAADRLVAEVLRVGASTKAELAEKGMVVVVVRVDWDGDVHRSDERSCLHWTSMEKSNKATGTGGGGFGPT